MTCIVGLEWNNKAYIGGDIQGTGGNISFEHTQPKIFERGGVLFGYTSSYRYGQIVENHLQEPLHVPEDRNGVYYWICQELVPKIQSTLINNNWNEGGDMLLAVHGELWNLQPDFSVLRPTSGFMSVGSGTQYALGSVKASLDIYERMDLVPSSSEELPKRIIKEAIEDAGFFCPSVGQQSVIMSNS
jgi:ATP-dependent protease HslVU (ClpYQ) peptidase subunit